MGDYQVIGFQKTFKILTAKLEKERPIMYKMGVLIAYSAELERGFGVKKKLKANSKGTNFNYELLDTEEKVKEYKEKVNKLQSEVNIEEWAKEIIEYERKSGNKK